MKKADIRIDGAEVRGAIDNRIYGSFLEHLGRAVYTGIYEPTHPTADADGFRADVADMVRALNVPVVRYPGGNFVSGYRWEDGIGDRKQRPVRTELAWSTLDTNEIGVDEFMKWCQLVGTDCMMAVNLGTRGIESAQDLLEYCNFEKGTYYSDLRRKNGAQKPYGIKLWCLGNEMDGEWQMGHKTAYEYGRLANETSKVLKMLDPSIETVACGSSNRKMKTFGEWERTVLRECYDSVDYLSLHQYLNDWEVDDEQSFYAQAAVYDSFIADVVAICDAVKAERNSDKTINLSFDEWNLWYHSNQTDNDVPKWIFPRPVLEDIYHFGDAVLFAAVMNTLVNHCDRVKIACLAQLVNVIAPIMTEANGGSYRQTTYWPYYYASNYGRGTALKARVDSPKYASKTFGETDALSVMAVRNDDGGTYMSIVNTSMTDEIQVRVATDGASTVELCDCLVHADKHAVNSVASPDCVSPKKAECSLEDGVVTLVAPPLSVHFIRVK